MIIVRSLCLAVFAFLSCFVQAHTVVLSDRGDCAKLASAVPQSFVLTKLTYSSDVSLCLQEFRYIVDLPEGSTVSNAQVCDAVARLFQKKLFQGIMVTVEECAPGIHIHIDLTGVRTLQKFKVRGIWVNRDSYKQYYLMEPGDPFDMDKHIHSMEKIKEACLRDGFFNANTETDFSYDSDTKSMQVSTNISRGNRFVMREVSLVVQGERDIPSEEISQIEQQLYKKFFQRMNRTRYSKSFIEQQARLVKQYLVHRGFLQPTIVLTETVDRKDCSVRLAWNIDLKKKRTFIFFGNRFFSHNQLLDRILQFGRSAWIVPASILAQELQGAYNAKGFWDVAIDSRDEDERSFFIITEGKQVSIEQVEVQHAHSIPQRTVLKCFASLCKRRVFFDRDVLNKSLDDLVDLYMQDGFLDIKIVTHEFVSVSPNRYKLIVTVDEGERTMLDAVTIPEYPDLEKQGPFVAMLNKKFPIPYDVPMIQEQKRWLEDHFQKKGFLFVSVKPELKKDDGQTALSWIITPGQQITFGKTIIQGSSKFPFSYVMRELQYQEGQVWDQEKIRQSFLRLKDLQLFDSVSFTPVSLPGLSEQPILLKFYQDDPFEIRVRSGFELQHIRQYQTFNGLAYKVGGTFMVKNPFQRGDQFRFDVDVARSHREIVMKYRYPWLFSLPLSSLFQLYTIMYEQPGFVGSKNNIYTILQTGFLIGLRHKIRSVDVGGNIGFEWAETKINDGSQALAIQIARAINFDVSLLGKRVPFIFMEPTIMVNLLDNTLNPTRGTFSLLSLKGMFPTKDRFADSYFIKLLVEQSWFIPIRFAVAALRLRFGHIFHRVFSDIMPNERFYLGGAHSIRSYGSDLSPPLGSFVDCDGKCRIVPRGGKTMMNVNAELRIPTFKNAWIVLFQDVGVLSSDQFADFRQEHVVAGTGFGVRYLTPIGPLRFDIAWKWHKHIPEEHSYNWFLTFGQAF